MGHIAHLRNQFKSINTFPKSYDYIQLIWRVKTHHLLFDNWKVLHPRMFGAKFGWNWPEGSWEKDFFNFVKKYFCNFVIISPWKRAWYFISINLNSLYSRMICAKFGWNLLGGSGEEDENVKSLQNNRWTDRRQTTSDQNS